MTQATNHEDWSDSVTNNSSLFDFEVQVEDEDQQMNNFIDGLVEEDADQQINNFIDGLVEPNDEAQHVNFEL